MSDYTSPLVAAIVYLALIVVVTAILSLIGCCTCGCAERLHKWDPKYYFADVLILAGVVWQVGVYINNPEQPPDDDAEKLSALIVLLGIASTVFVASNKWVDGMFSALTADDGNTKRCRVVWLMTLIRGVIAGLVIWALYPNPSFTLADAPFGVTILLFGGVVLVFLMPTIG